MAIYFVSYSFSHTKHGRCTFSSMRAVNRSFIHWLCDNVPLQIGNVEVFITEFAKEHMIAGTCSDYGLKPKSGQQMCEKFPERRAWAEHECNILRSGVFKSCYESFSDDVASAAYDRCLHDACGCSRGDDCRCLCTNLAVFAKLCSNLKGINLNWRTQELCRKCLSLNINTQQEHHVDQLYISCFWR